MKDRMKRVNIPEDQPVEHKMIRSSIEAAQKNVEGHNFDIRKHVLQYDDVMNRQREVIYGKRKDILTKESLSEEIWEDINNEFESLVNFHCASEDKQVWDKKEIVENVVTVFPLGDDLEEQIKSSTDKDEIQDLILEKAKTLYEKKKEEAGEETWQQVEKAVYLRVMDLLWIEHLDAMVRMREGIGLRGYAQKDPLAEYKQESYDMFQRLLGAISADITRMIFKVKVEARPTVSQEERRELEEKKKMAFKGAEEPKGDFEDEAKEIAQKKPVITQQPVQSSATVRDPSEKKVKIGRNDPCPCGSGKKYKKCCGG